MSKITGKKKEIAVNVLETNKEMKDLKMRKRGRSEGLIENLTVATKQSKVNNEVKGGAKRKIDFGKSTRNEQVNNNATRAVVTRGLANNSQRIPNENSLSKVRWTQEFMDKVRKSNEKYQRQKQKDKRGQNSKINQTNVNGKVSLQEKGDGIDAEVLRNSTDDEDLEILDYEDDLSIDEEEESQTNVEAQPPEPGCSKTVKEATAANTQTGVDLHHASEEQIFNNPVLQKMMEKFFVENFKSLQNNFNKQQTDGNGTGKDDCRVIGTEVNQNQIVKSPSDTTIYAPALQKRLTPEQGAGMTAKFLNEEDNALNQRGTNTLSLTQDQFIASFIDSVRSEDHPDDGPNRQHKDKAVELAQAQQKAEKTLLEAEKFKARVEQPGNSNYFNNSEEIQVDQQQKMLEQNLNDSRNALDILNIGSGVSDDDFFHLTCHIDPSLIHKIEKGEYIELEKLVPKEKLGGREENRLEWVQRDGGTFLVPAQKDNKIGNFRKWEQAFRAYATIYCGANPHRSREIWQYITVINTAASAYAWDNVYNYDITFRHLMAFNPQRSWAVTYNQMWNLSMRDPLPKNYSKGGAVVNHYAGSGYVGARYSNGNSSNTSSNPMQVRRNKSDYCWNFNKGIPCKFGVKCKFIERCKYCDSPTHGVNSCFKLQKKEGTSNKVNTGNYNGSNTNTNNNVSSNVQK